MIIATGSADLIQIAAISSNQQLKKIDFSFLYFINNCNIGE